MVQFQCLEDFAEHEVDEGARLPRLGAGSDGIVVLLLVGIYHVFYRQVLEQRVELTKNERLPQAAHAAVAVEEGMDKLKLVVEHARADEQMVP